MIYTFRIKILIIMIISILLPVILLSTYLIYISEDYYDIYIKDRIEKSIQMDINQIENFFKNSENEIQMYSSIIGLVDNDQYIFDLLNNYLISNPNFLHAYYADDVGNNYIDSNKIVSVDGNTRDWFLMPKSSNKYVILEPYIDLVTEKWVITLAAPVYKSNIFVGVFGVDMLITDIVKEINFNSNVLKNQYVVINDIGDVVYFDKTIDNSDIAKEIISKKSDLSTVIKKYNMKELQMDLYIIYSASEYFSNIKLIGKEIAVLFIFIVLLTTIFAFAGAKKMSVPLKSFKEKLKILNSTNKAQISKFELLSWDEEFHNLFAEFNKYSKIIELNKEKLSYRMEVLNEKNSKLIERNIDLEDIYLNLKNIDKKVRRSKDRYESVLGNIQDMIWVLDGDGKIVYVNNNLSKKLGYEESELITKSIISILNIKGLEVKELLFSRDFKKIEIDLLLKDKTSISVEASISRVFDDEKNIIFIYGICREVSLIKELHYKYNVKIQEQNLIMDLTETASLNISLNQITEVIFEKFNSIFGWSEGTIRLLNDDNDFVLIAKTQISDIYVGKNKIAYEGSLLGKIVKKGEIVYITNRDQLSTDEVLYAKLVDEGFTIIFIPVGNEEIGKGVISLTVDSKLIIENEEMLRSFTSTISIVVERAIIYEKLKKDYVRMIKVLAEAGDDKDSSSIGHSNRVAYYSKKIAENMYLEEEEIIDIEISGLLHDIGKIGISDRLLSSHIVLSDNDRKLVEEHAIIGRKMLEGIGLSENILLGIELHHKNFDLSGYPITDKLDGLSLFPRIIQVADQFDNYKESEKDKSNIEIWNIMNAYTSKYFCPQIMRIFKDVINKGMI